MAKKTLTDIKAALHRHATQVYGLRNQGRTLEERLKAKTDWRDLTPAAQARRIEEARNALRAEATEATDAARTLAEEVLGGAAERTSTARYFRNAKFTDDETLEELTRIRWALELPRISTGALGAMALDAQARGGDAAAALVVLIRREVDARTAAGGLDAVGLDIKAALLKAETEFPLPEALVAERDALAEIARTADGINSAFAELSLPPGLHIDTTDKVERWNAGDYSIDPASAPPPLPPPFEIHHNPHPNDQA